MKILAETMNQLIGPNGVYSSNAAASSASEGVSRSTFDRARNGDKLGASAIAIDKLDGIAKVFGVEVWQLFVPGLDLDNKPTLASVAKSTPVLTSEEKKLLEAFRKLGSQEQKYLLVDAKKYLNKDH